MAASNDIPTINAAWTEQQLTRNLNRVLSPTVCYKMLAALRKPDKGFSDIAKILEGDPYISAKVVTMANLSRRPGDPMIHNLERAIQVLGLRHVESLVLSVMLMGPLIVNDANLPRRKDLWRWIFGCSAAGDWLDEALQESPKPSERGQLMLGSLMMGLGCLILYAGLGRIYGKQLGASLRPVLLINREHKLFGVNHHEVTVWALNAIKSPPELKLLAQAMVDQNDELLVLKARAVEMLGARVTGFESARAEAWLVDALPKLGLPSELMLQRSLVPLREKVRQMARIFEADLGDWQQNQNDRQEAMIAAAAALDSLLIDNLTVSGEREPELDPRDPSISLSSE